MELQVHTNDGTEAGRTVSLSDDVFGIEPNDHVIWLDVRRIQANARQGTHKTKERNEVAGSTRKLYRQKGTGHARMGSARNPIRKSGGRAFGPRPRTYSLKINKKTQRLARRSALTYKAQDEALRVVDFDFETPNTKAFRALIKSLGLEGRKVLVLTAEHAPAIYKSGRNLRGVTVRRASDVSTLDVMQAHVVVLQEGAVDVLEQVLGASTAEA